MKTLAAKYPEAYQTIKTSGYTNVARMMTLFYRQIDLDRALSSNGSASGWCHRRHLPNATSEISAGKFLAASQGRSTAPETKVAPEKAPEPAPSAAPTDSPTYLVVCPSGVESKLEKVLALMGCESVQV